MSATLSLPSGSYPRRASTAGRARRIGQRMWQGLLILGSARAAPHLERLARQHETSNPEFARSLRQAAREGLLY